MNTEEIKKAFGGEYPAAMVRDGVRIPLRRETRFHRIYSLAGSKTEFIYSRFMDGSSSITLAELEREWPRWREHERRDFCNACSWLYEQSDFPDMLRFIMQHSGSDEWSAIALSVGCRLPQDEAFDILLRAMRTMNIGEAGNIAQAIAKTKHRDAEATLRDYLQSLWARASLWDDDTFSNRMAFNATTCIAHLIELGVSPADFEEQVRQLSRHVCSGNRDSCRFFLAKYYSWLQ